MKLSRKLGTRLLEWHRGSGSGVYLVGSRAYGGHDVGPGDVADALWELERVYEEHLSKRDEKHLDATIRLLKRESAAPNPSRPRRLNVFILASRAGPLLCTDNKFRSGYVSAPGGDCTVVYHSVIAAATRLKKVSAASHPNAGLLLTYLDPNTKEEVVEWRSRTQVQINPRRSTAQLQAQASTIRKLHAAMQSLRGRPATTAEIQQLILNKRRSPAEMSDFRKHMKRNPRRKSKSVSPGTAASRLAHWRWHHNPGPAWLYQIDATKPDGWRNVQAAIDTTAEQVAVYIAQHIYTGKSQTPTIYVAERKTGNLHANGAPFKITTFEVEIKPRHKNPCCHRRTNPIKAITAGNRVTIRTPHGQLRTGTAVMRGPHGWVLNLGGAHGTPGIAHAENITRVVAGRKQKRKSWL